MSLLTDTHLEMSLKSVRFSLLSAPSVCEECKNFFQTECPTHGPLLFVLDTPVAPGTANRATLTVPPGLEVFTSGDGVDVRCVNSLNIPKRALFGPYEGKLVSKDESSGPFCWIVGQKVPGISFETSLKRISGDVSLFSYPSPLQIVNSDNTYRCLDGGDETQANWMRSGCFFESFFYASVLKKTIRTCHKTPYLLLQ